MNYLTYNFPTTIRFGWGVSGELGAHLRENQFSTPLIVTDRGIIELDFFHKIQEQLNGQKINPVVFSDLHKNPVKSDVLKGAVIYREKSCDCIIGLGGGVAMDVARAIALKINHHKDLFEYDDLVGGDKYITNPIPYFITIPTTSGTGSEVGRSAIIADDETKQKKILFSPALMAKIVFADPELTENLPPFITAATGMDAFTHHLEAFLAKMYHPLCEGIALEGIHMVYKNIESAVNNPGKESRSAMMIASLMGAVAFQKGLGVVHSLAHPLSALLDTHHGLANAVNLPYGMEFNLEGNEEKFKRIARAMDLKIETGNEVIRALFDLNKKLGLPVKLNEIGVKTEHIEKLSDLAFADFCHPNNPKPVSRENFKELYFKAL